MWSELASGFEAHVHLPPGEHSTSSVASLSSTQTVCQRPEVVRAIHASASSQTWTECRGTIHHAFNTEHSPSAITVLPRVLSKMEVLLFAGDQDLICNYVGIENLIQAMTWNGATGLGVRVLSTAYRI